MIQDKRTDLRYTSVLMEKQQEAGRGSRRIHHQTDNQDR